MDHSDCREAQRRLDDVRQNRRSRTADDLAGLARLLGYTIDKKRGRGSHWFARGGPGPPFPIPTNRDAVSVGVTTRVLRILEEVFDDVCDP